MTKNKTHPFIHRSLVAVTALALISSAVTAQPQQRQQPPPARVEVVEASRQMMAPQVFMPGTIVSQNDSRIAAEISGRVLWVASEGTLVKAGDVLATIDDRVIKLTVARSHSQIAQLQSRLKYLKRTLKRTQNLATAQNVPTSRLEEAENQVLSVEQDLVQARIALETAEINLERSKVVAPFPGRVVERLAQSGEYSTPGRQLVRLVDTEHLEVSAQAPVKLATILKDKQRVSLRSGGEMVGAIIRALVPVGDAVSRTMEIRVTVPEGERFIVGAAVQIGLPSSAPVQVVVVPRDALVLRQEGTYVFRVKADNTAERLLVRTGAATGDIVAVFGGIEDGDKVVVRGGERLRPGQAVDLTSAARVLAEAS